MATFNKGESMKSQRIAVSASFPQKGEGRKGHNVALTLANDTKAPADVKTDPMLVYDHYVDKNGEKQNSFTASYSPKQWEAIEAVANKDGDAMVFEADVFPNRHGKGLVVNTNTLKSTDVPYDSAKHKQNTLDARTAKAEARKAAKEQDKSAEVEAEDELERE